MGPLAQSWFASGGFTVTVLSLGMCALPRLFLLVGPPAKGPRVWPPVSQLEEDVTERDLAVTLPAPLDPQGCADGRAALREEAVLLILGVLAESYCSSRCGWTR